MTSVRKSRKLKTTENEAMPESQADGASAPAEGQETLFEEAAPAVSRTAKSGGRSRPAREEAYSAGEEPAASDGDENPSPERAAENAAGDAERGDAKTVVVRTRPRRAVPYRETRSQHEGAGETRPRWSEPAPSNGSAVEGKAFPFRETAPVATPLPALPRLPSMPDIYGRPEPRLDQDNGKPRLTINELIRLNMIDLRELAGVYNISHDDLVALKKQEIIFSLLKAPTERGGIIYAYGSLEILPDG